MFKLEDSSFQFAFYGEGYTDGQDPSQGKPDGKIRTVVQGPGNKQITDKLSKIKAEVSKLI